jgi:hypothetical protein
MFRELTPRHVNGKSQNSNGLEIWMFRIRNTMYFTCALCPHVHRSTSAYLVLESIRAQRVTRRRVPQSSEVQVLSSAASIPMHLTYAVCPQSNQKSWLSSILKSSTTSDPRYTLSIQVHATRLRVIRCKHSHASHVCCLPTEQSTVLAFIDIKVKLTNNPRYTLSIQV